jgi:hypothetical protein
MTLHLPQFIQDDLFNQYDDERDRVRAGISSSMTQAQNTLPVAIRIKRNYKGMNKRRFFKRYVSLKF